MAQNRLRDYLEPIGSFEHNIFNLGMHNPGRYCGFDHMLVSGNPLQLMLNHDNTGIIYKDNQNVIRGPLGIVLTPQGVIISEDTPVGPISIDTNAGNTATRYDAIVIEHNYVNLEGGQAAIYKVLKGALNMPLKPTLTDPFKQVMVGIIELPPGATDLNDCKYYKEKCPDSGDGEDARLTTPNIFSATQLLSASSKVYIAPDFIHNNNGFTSQLFLLSNEGNTFKVLPTSSATTVDGISIKDLPIQEGAEINILANDKVTIREARYFEGSGYYAQGFRGFTLPSGLCNTSVSPGGGSTLGLKPNTGEEWVLKFVYVKGRWQLASVGGAGKISAFNYGDIILWYGDINNNFDDFGLGKNLKAGWQICNGNNGAPDMRGKIPTMAVNVPSAGQPILTSDENIRAAFLNPADYIISSAFTKGGSREVTLIKNNLPDINITLTGYTKGVDHNSGVQDITLKSNSGTATQIDIPLGGSSTPFPIIAPYYSSVFIMKI